MALLIANGGIGIPTGRALSVAPTNSTPSGAIPQLLDRSSPYVLTTGGFAIESVTTGTSVGFISSPGDAIVVWSSLYGLDTVASVTDSVGDSFNQIVNASMTFGTTGAHNGLSVWVAGNVRGGTSVTLTVTLHPRFANSLNDSSVVFADVTGVAVQPLDAVGPVVNSSTLTNGQSAGYSSSVTANASDLVLSGVGARNYDDFTAQGGDSRVVEHVGVLSSASLNAMTTAAFQVTQGPTSGLLWANATSNKTAAWVGNAVSIRGGGPPPSSAPSPHVSTQGGFSIESVPSGSSASFTSGPGDAIVVWASIYGVDTVASVTDSVGDSFNQIVNASMTFGTTGAHNGLSVWVAGNVRGGTSVTLTVTLHPRFANSLNDSSVVFADVTGVAVQPLDAVGPVVNSSTLTNGQSAGYSSSVTANASDLVLSGVGARNYDDFTAQGGDSRVVEHVGVLSSASLNAMTTAAFQVTQGPTSGLLWANATSNKTTAWIGNAIALKWGGQSSPPEYWVTIAESGLQAGTLWTVSVASSSVSAISPNAMRLAEPNGSYAFTVAPETGYLWNPLNGTAVVSGSGVNLSIVYSMFFPVRFVPSGLPSGTAWTVTLGNQRLNATAPSAVTFQRTNGVYAFAATAPGYTGSPGVGSVVVNGAPVTAGVAFGVSGKGYAVVFASAGLPADQTWAVSLGGSNVTAPAQANIEFLEPNGSYSYTVATSSGFVPDHATGSIKINGNTLNQNVNFKVPGGGGNVLFVVSFVEQGLANNTSWSVDFAGKTYKATAPGGINASVQNGSYDYQVANANGYVTFPAQGKINVAGRPLSIPVSFDQGTDVRFSAGGLPGGGLAWSVVLAGVQRTSFQLNRIDFGEAAGTYNYSIPNISGFTVKPSSGTVTVGTNSVNVNLQFSPVAHPAYNITFGESGLPSGTGWYVSVGNLTASATAPAPVTLSLASGSYTVTPGSVPAYRPIIPSGALQVGKADTYATFGFASVSAASVSPVTFYESGLPSGTAWSVSLNGTSGSASAPSAIGFSVGNGSYVFVVQGVPGYGINVTAGTLFVNGAAASVALSFTARIQHVVEIVLENFELKTVLASGGYEQYLWNTYGHASNFYAACHGSLPDYAAMTSGRALGCGNGSIPIQGLMNLADLLQARSQSWMGYFEGMGSSCQLANGGSYESDHNPFILYKDVRYNSTRCNAHIVNSAQFNSSVAAGTLPMFSMYVPNLPDDCYLANLSFCDHWLRNFLTPMLNSTNATVHGLMAHTAFFIVYDEGSTNLGYSVGGIANSWCKNTTGQQLTVCGGQVDLTVVSPYSVGTTYSAYATDYNMESTIEWLFGLGSDGGYDGTASFPSMNSLFSFS